MKELLIKLLGNKDHLGRRYLIFLIGSLIVSFGVASTTKAGLGTSPICSIPYALSLIITKISFGNWLVIFCFMQIVVQIILLRKNCVVSELIMQVVLGELNRDKIFVKKESGYWLHPLMHSQNDEYGDILLSGKAGGRVVHRLQ